MIQANILSILWNTKKFHPWHLTYPEEHNGQKKSTKACLIIHNAAQKACGQERMHRKKTCRWTLVSNWLLSAYSLKTDAMEGTVTCHANATSNSLWSYNVHENSATSRSPIRTISTQKALSNTVMHPKDALWEVNKVHLSLCQIGCWSTKLHNNVTYPILMQIPIGIENIQWSLDCQQHSYFRIWKKAYSQKWGCRCMPPSEEEHQKQLCPLELCATDSHWSLSATM